MIRVHEGIGIANLGQRSPAGLGQAWSQGVAIRVRIHGLPGNAPVPGVHFALYDGSTVLDTDVTNSFGQAVLFGKHAIFFANDYVVQPISTPPGYANITPNAFPISIGVSTLGRDMKDRAKYRDDPNFTPETTLDFSVEDLRARATAEAAATAAEARAQAAQTAAIEAEERAQVAQSVEDQIKYDAAARAAAEAAAKAKADAEALRKAAQVGKEQQDYTKFLLAAGGVVAVGAVLYFVLKPKKTSAAGL